VGDLCCAAPGPPRHALVRPFGGMDKSSTGLMTGFSATTAVLLGPAHGRQTESSRALWMAVVMLPDAALATQQYEPFVWQWRHWHNGASPSWSGAEQVSKTTLNESRVFLPSSTLSN
jgi:hypothetical protein